jgi:hypothetical protein
MSNSTGGQDALRSEQESSTQPNVAQLAADLAKGGTDAKLAVLLEILLKREARIAQQEQAAEDAKQRRAEQRQRNAKSGYDDDNAKQAKCRHLKGGKNRVRTQVKDYSVYMHTFINAERVIICQLCKMHWKVRDTREKLYRHGQFIPNHTGIGWAEAMVMLGETTNKPSSSEIPMLGAPVVDGRAGEV